jgi:hypothetical protein
MFCICSKLIIKEIAMGMSIQNAVTSTANMAQAASSVSTIQQQQLVQSMQTPAPQEPVSKPVGNVGNNIDVRA